MEHVWFLEGKGLPSMRASSLLHILKDPDFSLLFPLLTQRLPVPLWICTRMGVGVPGVDGGRLYLPVYEKLFTHSGKMSFWDLSCYLRGRDSDCHFWLWLISCPWWA